MRLVRMDADRKADRRPERVSRSRLRGLLGVARFEDDQRALEPGVLRPLDDRLEIGGERLVGQMTVAVNHSIDVEIAGDHTDQRNRARSTPRIHRQHPPRDGRRRATFGLLLAAISASCVVVVW